MKKVLLATSFVIAAALAQGSGIALAGSLVSTLATDKVYNVEIIAHANCPKGSFTGSNRRVIAVQADFKTGLTPGEVTVDLPTDNTNLIFLVPGPDFQVLDGNACDTRNNGAVLQLPPDVSAVFSVWVRLVGKPGSGITAFTCAEGTLVGTAITELICSTDKLLRTRMTGHGEPKFMDATKQLLFISNGALADVGCDSTVEGLFAPCLTDFFWVWDTTGRPHAQVWFVQQ